MRRPALLLSSALTVAGCASSPDEPAGPFPPLDVTGQAHGCWTVASDAGALTRQAQGWTLSDGTGTPLRMQPSDLGTYLLYDPDGGYVVAEDGRLVRQTTLPSDATLFDDSYVSGAEWLLQTSTRVADRHQLASRRTGEWLGAGGLVADEAAAAAVQLVPADGCATFPELALNASGSVTRTTFEDGDLFGFVDMHSHMFTNYGFGGGMFRGAPFHRLGVEHALGDCEAAHGPMGRKDFFGYAYDSSADAGGFSDLVPAMLAGELPVDNHATQGYPDFTDWPDVRTRSTHNAQYHRWIERAWMAGLRLVVQHATSNAVICNLAVGEGWSPSRYDCEDMTAVDRELDAAWEMERYVDAQSGGAGQGWFRIVTTPAEAREVIGAGKLAVLLGIETSDLFDCHLTGRPGGPVCDEAWVDSQLDAYAARGVRVLFPQHKYDNAFAPGDGSDGFIEVGNFLNSGHYTNKVTEDCPDVQPGFDGGDVTFGGLLEPRDEYLSQPPEDMTDFPLEPIDTLLPYFAALLQDPVPGDHCQNGTITPVGEHLISEMMRRGMLLEVDHLPRRAYVRAYEMLFENEYPALGTHNRSNGGLLWQLGGLSQGSLGRCFDPANPGGSLAGYAQRLQQMVDAGMHRSLGFAFDINGFAGGPGPRFGPQGCGTARENPITSFGGDTTFTEPVAGNRVYDFNTEGMVHVGLIPEYIEDARRDGATDEQLEPIFRSAEGYIRMWERAEARAAVLRAR